MKFIFVLLLCVSSYSLPAFSANNPNHVLMIVNEGFQAPEYYTPRKVFEDSGFKITVAAKRLGPIKPDERNVGFPSVEADIVFSQVITKEYDAIVFAGGNGAWTDYFPTEEVHRIVQESLASDKVLGLICASTGLLGVTKNFDAKTPIAAGRKATGYFRVQGLIEVLGQMKYENGVEGKPHVVVDGNLITGRDPISSELFGKTIAQTLNGFSDNH